MTPANHRLRSLYICYLSLDDPLTHTQVVAYLRGLADAGHTIHLLTFESRSLSRAERKHRRREMAAVGVSWHRLRYHKHPSLPATMYDTLVGSMYTCWLTLRFHLNVFHARTHVPAAMAMLARRVLGRRAPALIFDIRGLMGEEYVDSGRWEAGSLPFRLVKGVERAAIGQASGIVVLTERVRDQLFGAKADPRVFVIPCCADIDELSAGSPRQPDERVPQDATVMIYVGKLEGWYMAKEMAEFFAQARELVPGLHFLVLTQGDPSPIRDRLEELGVAGAYTITSAAADQVGSYLRGSDFGISFIRPSPSKASSSPTKVGEYLAAGLPVLATAGVGDLDTLLTDDIGVLVAEHSPHAYAASAARIAALLADPEVRDRCRATAMAELSLTAVGIPRYVALYLHVADTLPCRSGAGSSRA